MSGIINIEEHNAKIKMIEQLKPVCSIKIKGKEFYLDTKNFNDGSIQSVRINNYSGYCIAEGDKDRMQGIAAIIIKAFGPIQKELIDSVEVK